MSKLDNMLEEEGLHRFEGETGVQNLAIVARKLGYKDDMWFGQFSHKGCYGDLIEFLQDNPGAIEAVLDFIRENEDGYEGLEGYADEDDDDASDA